MKKPLNLFDGYINIDIETWSSVDLGTAGVHAYAASPDFEILIAAYSLNGAREKSFCPTLGDPWPEELVDALHNDKIEKRAQNAAFEITCLRAGGFDTDARYWRCTMVKAYSCGLPGSLKNLSKVLELGTLGKDAQGSRLIKQFCIPCHATKKNGGRRRNLPHHFPLEWAKFVKYCEQDVVAEKAVFARLSRYDLPHTEWELWALDQRINDRGVLLDMKLAECALALRAEQKVLLLNEMSQLMEGELKPNSPVRLRKWLEVSLGRSIPSIAKDNIGPLLEGCDNEDVLKVMDLRSRLSKTSVSKFRAMLATACPDFRARGFLQFYGASRTGRWAGRRIQPQNLPRNYLKDMDAAIEDIKTLPFGEFVLKYPDLNSTLSQCIRPALIADPGHAFVFADYSAIEARVMAYLSMEEWRLEVFRTHGKIYEASAAATFGVPFESVTKESALRHQGKTTELALGYQGSVGAMRTMDFNNMLSEDDEIVKEIVNSWRAASPNIVRFWRMLENAAKRAVSSPGVTVQCENGGPVPITMCKDENALWIELPSGRRLAYWGAHIAPGKYGDKVCYFGMDDKNQWVSIDTYGGKLSENIVQAYARDIMGDAMLRADKVRFPTQLHVHDEFGGSIFISRAEKALSILTALMSIPPKWAGAFGEHGKPIPLAAEGFISTYYKK
jgi:DNA polymerase